MDSRRDFLKKAAVLSGAAGAWSVLPASIQAALAIAPEKGSTVMDAEHVVILMQENRSFDHCYGSLKGVRGFNDPRALRLPNQNPVWLQSNAAGETYAPFRLDIKETNATWMGSLPHSWTDQVDARNGGKCDRWLEAKRNGRFARMPLTLGYYSREDVPFYYALADAFTVCDQHFCSSLTGTTPNRLYLWTGAVRPTPDASGPACVRNEEVDYGREARWTTFPERLEEQGISWRIYQNELSVGVGFEGEEDAWLSNFTDNPIEWFTQYGVRFSAARRKHLAERQQVVRAELEKPAPAGETAEQTAKRVNGLKAELAQIDAEREQYSDAKWSQLPQRSRNLHQKAFTTNAGDPDHHRLTTLKYLDQTGDGETERTVQVPAGDVLHQFRKDVESGNLPRVSWLVAPENFSDHPGAAWYGAWYLSEVMEILTKNPEVWKKTVFLVTYDENDGYFDHVPPFVPPHPAKPETGRCSEGIDTRVEWVTMEEDLKRKPQRQARESPIGLGYRVPLVIASPWSRGGWVCSEVFDHTSVLQFLEGWLTHKTKRPVKETNISEWRRTVCGDLTSAFRPYQGEAIPTPTFIPRDPFIQQIHRARFKKLPTHGKALTPEEVAQARREPGSSSHLPKQEPGVRPSCALPYQLYVDGAVETASNRISLRFLSSNEVFGARSAGSPFNVYAYGAGDGVMVRNYAVAAGKSVSDTWELSTFTGGAYHLEAHGPNGFLREFQGAAGDPLLEVSAEYGRVAGKKKQLSGALEVRVVNRHTASVALELVDNGYGGKGQKRQLKPGASFTFRVETGGSAGWYDCSLRAVGAEKLLRRFAGRVETGAHGTSDPVMGKVRA